MILLMTLLLCDIAVHVHAEWGRSYTWKSEKNRKMIQNVEILDSIRMESLIQCTVACTENDRCVSTNLSPTTGGGSGRTCELLDGARLRETEAELEEAIGWTHTCE